MATVKFVAGKPNSKKMSVVYLQYIHNHRRIVFTSTLKIEKALHWDNELGKVKKSHPDALMLNEIMVKQASKVNQLILQCKLNEEEPSVDRIRDLYKASFKAKVEFFDAFKTYREEIRASITKSSNYIYDNVYSLLKSFSTKERIQWSKIDASFLERFSAHMFKQGLASSTARRNISYLKPFLNNSYRKGYLRNKDYETFTIKVPRKAVISLTEEELEKIRAVKLPESHARVRDVFYFSCITGGIRLSDVGSIGKHSIENTKSGRVLKLTAIKTRAFTTIPLLDEAYEILRRRNFNLVTVSHQRYLRIIKEVAKRAGINKPQILVSYKGTTRIETIVPKYETIGSHTARRTFISISLQRNVPITMIAAVTHGGNVTSLMRYVAIDEDKKNEAFTKAWANIKGKAK
jgi:site-specific recombinase XerD